MAAAAVRYLRSAGARTAVESVDHLMEQWGEGPDVASFFQDKAAEELRKKEDERVFSLLEAASDHHIPPEEPGREHAEGFLPFIDHDPIPPEMRKIMDAPLQPERMYMHPQTWKDLTADSPEEMSRVVEAEEAVSESKS